MTGADKGKEQTQQTNTRLDISDIEVIQELVDNGEFESVSAFIRQAVKEKINPKMRRARLRKELLEVLADPDTRQAIANAGYGYFLKSPEQ